jgi:O-acetylserine/cysteine efflux transporter
MLVPFFGITSAALALGEPVHLVDVLGGVLVVGGVMFGALRRQARVVAEPERTLVG